MNRNPSTQAVQQYGADSTYLTPPTLPEQLKGVVPLDTLPASWWNWLWNTLTTQEINTQSDLATIYDELSSLIVRGGGTPSSASATQVRDAVLALIQTPATDTTVGGVKSSSVNGQVSIDSTGIMTANGLGSINNLDLGITSRLSVVDAINELYQKWVSLSTDVGDKANLNTSTKVNIVSAVNEVNSTISFSPSTPQTTDTATGGYVTYADENEKWQAVEAGIGDLNHFAPDTYADTIAANKANIGDNDAAYLSILQSLGITPLQKDMSSLIQALVTAVKSVSGGASPTGCIIAYGGQAAPAGWLMCDGSAVSREDYADLYAVIGTSFGGGDGETTFNVPDLRGRTVFGAGYYNSAQIPVGAVRAGLLPNITGGLKVDTLNNNNAHYDSGAIYSAANSTYPYTGSVDLSRTAVYWRIDASRSSSLYGTTDRVVPCCVHTNFIIKT